jgi:hypothetical protein
MDYLYAIALLLLVMSPPLVPLAIAGTHAIANWRRHYEMFRSTIRPQGRALRSAL